MSLTPQDTAELLAAVRRVIREEVDDLRVATQLTVNRGTTLAVDDSLGVQELQTEVLAGEVLEEVEHFQPYGFTSHAPVGSEACMLTVGDDRAHMIALGVNARADRCTDLEVGDSCMYSLHGTEIHHKIIKGVGGMIHTVPLGGKIQIGDDTATDPVALEDKVHILVELLTASVTAYGGTNPPPTPVTFAHLVALGLAMAAAVNRPAAAPPGAGPLVGASKVFGI